MAQAEEITRTEAAVPGSERELLDLARKSSLTGLRDRARDRRLGAIDPERLYATQRAHREIRHWYDDLGLVRGTFAFTPEVGVPFVNRLEAETDRL